MRSRVLFVVSGIVIGLTFDAAMAIAWTGPTASPPNNNVSAPINVSGTSQVKNGDLGVNNFSAFGNELLSGLGVGTGRHLNFDYTAGGTSGTGDAGYGIRDNAGTIEFKNLGGAWTAMGAGASLWAATGGNIHNSNAGNVGVGTANPGSPLTVYDAAARSAFTGSGLGTVQIQEANGNGYYGALDFTGSGSSYAESRIASLQQGNGSYLQFGTSNSYATGITNTALTIDPTGNVGVGVTSPSVRLELPQNTAIKLGNAYLSSGGDYLHLANNEWYNGTAWTVTAPGDLIQIAGQQVAFYSHDAAGNHATQAYINSSGVYGGAFLYMSDARLKSNVQNLDQGLLTLMKLRPVSFTWNEKDPWGRAGQSDIGLIAQEVEKVVPEAVHTGADGYKAVDYPKIIPILVKAVQEQEATIQDQQAKIDSLEARVTQLEAKLSQ
jgi:hypothetical protein